MMSSGLSKRSIYRIGRLSDFIEKYSFRKLLNVQLNRLKCFTNEAVGTLRRVKLESSLRIEVLKSKFKRLMKSS